MNEITWGVGGGGGMTSGTLGTQGKLAVIIIAKVTVSGLEPPFPSITVRCLHSHLPPLTLGVFEDTWGTSSSRLPHGLVLCPALLVPGKVGQPAAIRQHPSLLAGSWALSFSVLESLEKSGRHGPHADSAL